MQTKPKLRINLMWKKYPSAFPNSFPQVHFSSFLNIRWKLYLTCWGENAFIPRLIVTLIGVIAGQMSTWVLGVTFFCVLCMGKDMTFWFTCIWQKKYYSNIEYISVYIYVYIYMSWHVFYVQFWKKTNPRGSKTHPAMDCQHFFKCASAWLSHLLETFLSPLEISRNHVFL